MNMPRRVRKSEAERRSITVELFWDTDDGVPTVQLNCIPDDLLTARLWLTEYVELQERMEPALQRMREGENRQEDDRG